MSCEERFGIPIPNRAVAGLKTVGDAIRLVTARLIAPAEPEPPRKPLRLPCLALVRGASRFS